jgi:ABC-type uncharacterized transport system fused permease/ATPase subunit
VRAPSASPIPNSASAGRDHEGPAELSADLAVGLLQASLLLVSFIGVLWVLSAQVLFTFDGRSFAIPGYMVWCALAYAVGGSWLAWRVGRPLSAFNAERYAREVEPRFARCGSTSTPKASPCMAASATSAMP